MVRDILKLDLSLNFFLKSFEPSGENLKFGGREQ